MTFPAVKLLRKNFPQAFFGYVVDEKFSEVLTLLPEVNKVYNVNFYGKSKKWYSLNNWKNAFKFINNLQNEKFDIVINFHQMFRAGVLGLLSGARYKVYQKTNREFMQFLANIPLAISSKEHYVIQNIKLVSQYFKIDTSDIKTQDKLFITSKFIKVKENNKILVVAPFTSPSHPENRWELKKFINLINDLVNTFKIIIVGTKIDNNEILKFKNILNKNIENLCGKTTIKQLIEIITQSDILIGNDSGAAHMSAFLGKKTVVIFGPAHPKLTAPFSKNTYIISKHLNCSPCYGKLDCLKNQPRNFKNDLSEILPCLNSITEEEVLKIVLEITNEK